MKQFLPILTVVAGLLFGATAAQSQTNTAVTDPVGFTTIPVAAKPVNARGLNLISLNMTRPVVYQGLVPTGGLSTVSNRTVLTFPANTFTNGQFSGTTNAHYFELTSGGNAGLTSQILTNTTTQITLADNISETITAGTSTFKVRPNWTLATALPNGGGLQGGTTPNNSDTVTIVNPVSGGQVGYYYNSTFSQWRSGTNNANNTVLPPDVGLLVERRSTNSGVNLTLAGAVKTGNAGIYAGGNANPSRISILPNPFPMQSVTLANSGLYTTNAATGVVGGATPGVADTVTIINPTNGVQTGYYYNTTFSQWRTGTNNANSVTIPEGAAVILTRKSNRAPFVWYVPQPAMNLNP